MSEYSGLARKLLRYRTAKEPDGQKVAKLEFSNVGKEELEKLLLVGSSAEEICDFFILELDDYNKLIGKGGQVYELHRYATAQYKRTLRENQLKLSGKNAAMGRHLGAHGLGQPKDPAPKADVNKPNPVVGTMPDYGATADEWKDKFVPKNRDTGDTIEKIRRMTGVNKDETPPSPEEDV